MLKVFEKKMLKVFEEKMSKGLNETVCKMRFEASWKLKQEKPWEVCWKSSKKAQMNDVKTKLFETWGPTSWSFQPLSLFRPTLKQFQIIILAALAHEVRAENASFSVRFFSMRKKSTNQLRRPHHDVFQNIRFGGCCRRSKHLSPSNYEVSVLQSPQ